MPAHPPLTALAACALALAGLAACAEAGAATTIGPDLSTGPNSACTSAGGCTATNLSSGGGRAITAPSNGVVVRFRIRHGPTPPGASYTMKVLSGTFTGGLPTFAVAAQAPPDRFDDFVSGGIDAVATVDAAGRPRGIPIAAGQRIGVFAPGGVAFERPLAGSVLAERDGDHAGGAAAYTVHAGFEVLVNADIEPDADGDGYGDQSQDNCPTTANEQSSNPCGGRPPPGRGPAVPPTRAPADYVKPRIGRVVRPRRPVSSLLREGVSVPIACYGGCSARGRLVMRRGSSRPVTVGRGRRSASGGRFRLKLKLTRRGRRLLRRSRRNARLGLRVRAVDRWGSSSRAQKLLATVPDTARRDR